MNISIERGEPTPEELAALIAVLTAVASTSERVPPVSVWWRSGLPVQRMSWRESALAKSSYI